jgi:hypothetical protein
MDRQDIDALLIGALYGELTPADEARLTAHLDSHPGDRGALDDLKVARQAVADSRIFAVHLDPPQHVSALLLQEAHRRAPKRAAVAEEKEGWFYRFTRTFLAHPAMAAAAMLVLVLGGAGIVYMKKGDQFAGQEVSVSRDEAAAPQEAPAAIAQGSATATPSAGSGSAMNAGLYEGAAGTASITAEDRADKAAESASDRWDSQKAAADQRNELAAEQTKRKQAAPSRGIAVGTEKGMVKELERAKGAKNDEGFGYDLGGDSMRAPGAASGGGGAGRATTGATIGRADPGVNEQQTYAQPPPPSAAPATAPNRAAPGPVATTTPPRAPEPAVDAKKAPAKVATSTATAKPTPEKPMDAAPAPKQEAKTDSSLLAWAKGEHARAVALAQKGECTAAAKLALGVSTRASDYYAQYMATDRALKQCAQYINAERDKDAEKSAKSRAQKRTNADESPAPTTTK